ncbi:hypothetical protein F2Q70_00022614 [Brassica cretica]|uniref:Uncharacterized protein n=1 Tax=Brassica cretica TaxID=69181 RepID=A0A8S9GUW7_BRACR|nr:hypothetical protein F2Q70_00022614 [Brassica cretica]
MASSNWSDEKSLEQDAEEELSKGIQMIVVHTKPVHINHVHTDVVHTFHVDNHIASASSQPFSIVGYHSGGGGGYGGGGGDVVVMKVTVALLVNVVVDEDLVVSGCVDVVDVIGRVADGSLGGGYESGNRGRGDTGGVVDEDFMVSGSVDVVDVTGRVADGALGDGYESVESIVTVSIQKFRFRTQKKTLLMASSNWSDEKSLYVNVFEYREQDAEEELSKVEYICGYHSGGGGGYGGGGGGGGGDVVVMKVTVALLVNVRVVDEDLTVSGCVDVTGRVADGALGGGYESGNRGRGDTGGGD